MSAKSSRDVVELHVGDEHAVELTGLGTAGYRWSPQVDTESGIARVDRVRGEAGSGGAVGASVDEVFKIRAVRPGTARIRFAQRRSWESEDRPPAGEHTVDLRVLED